MNEVDIIIRDSLREFSEHLRQGQWRGREREAVSYYVFGFLLRQIGRHAWFKDPTQIVIEGAVRQHPGDMKKKHVNKDLLLWSKDGMTCWDNSWEPTNVPIAVLEWKVYRPATGRMSSFSNYDLEWLMWFTKTHAGRVGYAVGIDLGVSPSRLKVARVWKGNVNGKWLAF